MNLSIQRPIRINPDCFERCSDYFLSTYRSVQNHPSSYASCLQKITSIVTLVVSFPFTLIGAFFAWLSKTRKTVEEIGPCSKAKAFQQLLLSRMHPNPQYYKAASLYLNKGLEAYVEKIMGFKIVLTDFESTYYYFMTECAEMQYTEEEFLQRTNLFITQFQTRDAEGLKQACKLMYRSIQQTFKSANNLQEVKNQSQEIYRNFMSQRRVPYPVPRERPPAIKINPQEIRKKIDDYEMELDSSEEIKEFNNQIKAYMKSQGNKYEICSEDEEEMQVISVASYLQVEKRLMGYDKNLFWKRVSQFSVAEGFSEQFTDRLIERLKVFLPKEAQKSMFQKVVDTARRGLQSWRLSYTS